MKYYSEHTSSFYDSEPEKEWGSLGIPVTDEQYTALTGGSEKGTAIRVIGGVPTLIGKATLQAEQKAMLTSCVQSLMDKKAQDAGYESLLAAISYADEKSVAVFQEEGKAFREWRSLTWKATFELIESDVLMTPDQLLAKLPPLKPPI